MRRPGDREAAVRGYEKGFGGLKRGPLSNREKEYIADGWAKDQTVLEIASTLHRHTSTVRNVFNIHDGKPTLALSKVLTEAEFNRGTDAVCLVCGYGHLEFNTDGTGYTYEECPKCRWFQYFGRVA